eukprot:4452309-Prymnesium_polylepis.1
MKARNERESARHAALITARERRWSRPNRRPWMQRRRRQRRCWRRRRDDSHQQRSSWRATGQAGTGRPLMQVQRRQHWKMLRLTVRPLRQHLRGWRKPTAVRSRQGNSARGCSGRGQGGQ